MTSFPARYLLGLCCMLAAASAYAELASYYCGNDMNRFTSRTGATLATQPYPDSGTITGSYTSGSVTFKAGQGSSLNFANWTSAIPLDGPAPDLALNGNENLVITLAEPVYSLALEYDRNSSLDSTYFVVNFYLDNPTLPVASDHQWRARPSYQVPIGQHPLETQHCFGWWSDQPFDKVTIGEINPNGTNEYFGRVFTGTRPPPPKLLPPVNENHFGWSLAARDQLLAVGSLGHAVDFFHIGGPGQLPALISHLPIQAQNIDSAWALSMDGTEVAIGNPSSDALTAGSVLIAKPDGSGHYTDTQAIAAPSAFNQRFGESLALDEPYLAVGAPETPSDDGLVAKVGKVFIYQHAGDAWTLAATLDAVLPDMSGQFGRYVALRGDELYVAAVAGDSTSGYHGTLYRYLHSGLQWLPDGELPVPIGDESAAPSPASQEPPWIAVQGNRLAVYALKYFDQTDDLYAPMALYGRSGHDWLQEYLAFSPDQANYQRDTSSAAFLGDTALIGVVAVEGDLFASLGGTHCIEEYRRDALSGTWHPTVDRTHPLTLRSDGCGRSVALTRHFAFAGAPNDTSSTSLDNEGENNPNPNARGSVTVTQRGIFWDGFDP